MAEPSLKDSLKELKGSLTLDLSAAAGRRQQQQQQQQLQTPDLIKLIRSPEVEKLFSQGLNAVTTPTPTKLLYPADVTNAQRQYAQGFLDALSQIQQLNGFVPPPANLLSPGFLAPLVSAAAASSVAAAAASSVAAAVAGVDVPKSTPSPLLASPTRDPVSVIMQMQMSSLPNYGLMPPPHLSFPSQMQLPTASSQPVKLEAPPPPQEENKEMLEFGEDTEQPCSSRPSVVTSPSRSCSQDELLMSGYSPGFDLDEQDKKKLDRKRARNRLAATKCRQRKIEKIKDLEVVVAEEKRRGTVLEQQLDALRKQVAALEAQSRRLLHQ